jgi:glycosyltransferase involved in cell wall biosynthesis
MNKPLFVISCPIDTYSGYGARARDIVKAIIKTDKYDVKVLPQRWGATPFGFIEDHKEEWGFLTEHILTNPQLPKQPEIWAQITIPNEFQAIGKYNIGITAGIETSAVKGEWVEGCNRMNLVITSSEFAKKTFESMNYEIKNQQGQLQGYLKLNTPIEVIFEGVNTDIYKVIESHQIKSIDLKDIKEDFAYLFVGHWMQGDLGEDRKNVGLLIKAFYEIFKNKTKKPALILKASGAGSSYLDRDMILNKINQIKQSVPSQNLPNIYLLHGEFSDSEMNELYNHPKVKAMVSLTKGEGFGRPLLEFSLSKKPIIATNWSAHTEFLHPEHSILLGGNLTPVHPSSVNDWIIAESQWFSVDTSQVGLYLKDVFENYKKYTDKGKRQGYRSKTEFSWDKMLERVDEVLTQRIPDFPKEVPLELPKLQLPKLQKV